MTPRSLFILILRVLGILLAKELLVSIPQLLVTVLLWFRGYDLSDGLFMTFLSLITIAIYLWLSYSFIFKADLLVTKFGLDKGFTEETLALNMSVDAVLRIAIIVSGALVLLFEIPTFCRILYELLREKDLAFMDTRRPDWSPALFSGVKIILGLLIIGERSRILQLLTQSKAINEKAPQSEEAEIFEPNQNHGERDSI